MGRLDAVPLQNAEKSLRDVLAGVARLGHLEPGGKALEQGLLGVQHVLGRTAEIDRAAQRAVVAAMHAGDLEERPGARLEGLVVPGEMRCRGVLAGR